MIKFSEKTIFILDENGVVAEKFMHEVTKNELKQTIEALLK